jgi:hypothetical protein
MDPKSFSGLAGIIFLLVSLAHLLRAVMIWPVVVANWSVPMWLSWIAFLIAGALGFLGLMLAAPS